MAASSIVKHKSMEFAKRIVHLYQYLGTEHHEYVMAKQILRSGTSIGANIARKETAETLYWLELLNSCSYIPDNLYQSLYNDGKELLALLTASIKTCSE